LQYRFKNQLKKIPGLSNFRIEGDSKCDLIRIRQKIETIEVESEGITPYRVYDLIRCTIFVTTIEELKDAYEALK